MAALVADTSALVSLGIVADADPEPLSLCLDAYEVTVPNAVIDELDEITAARSWDANSYVQRARSLLEDA